MDQATPMNISKHKLSFFSTTVIMALAGVMLITMFGIFSKYDFENYMLIALIYLVIFVPWMLAARCKQVDLAEPIFLYSIISFFLFVPSVIWFLTDPPGVLNNVNIIPGDKAIIVALSYILGSQIAFLFGYGFVKFILCAKFNLKNPDIPKIEFDVNSSVRRIFLCAYIFSILFRFYLFSKGWKGATVVGSDDTPPVGLFSILTYLANIWVLYYGAFAIISCSNVKYFKLFLYFFTPCEIFILFAGGARRDFLLLVFINLTVYWYRNNSIPVRKMLFFGIPVIGIFLPISTVYHDAVGELSHQGIMINSWEMFIKLFLSALDSIENTGMFLQLMVTPILRQFSAIIPTTVAVKYFDDPSKWLYGGMYFEALKSFVPSFLIGDKFAVMQEMLDTFGAQFNIIPFYPTVIAPLFWAEAIWNFGLIGLIGISIIAGGFVYILYWLLMRRLSGFFPRWFYISNIIYASYGISGGVTGEYLLFLRNTFTFFGVYVIYVFIRKNSKISQRGMF
jgi:hypothetical protein